MESIISDLMSGQLPKHLYERFFVSRLWPPPAIPITKLVDETSIAAAILAIPRITYEGFQSACCINARDIADTFCKQKSSSNPDKANKIRDCDDLPKQSPQPPNLKALDPVNPEALNPSSPRNPKLRMPKYDALRKATAPSQHRQRQWPVPGVRFHQQALGFGSFQGFSVLGFGYG